MRIAAVVANMRLRHLDWFVVSLIGVIAAATLLPCRDNTAVRFHYLGLFAISSLFFLRVRIFRVTLCLPASIGRGFRDP